MKESKLQRLLDKLVPDENSISGPFQKLNDLATKNLMGGFNIPSSNGTCSNNNACSGNNVCTQNPSCAGNETCSLNSGCSANESCIGGPK